MKELSLTQLYMSCNKVKNFTYHAIQIENAVKAETQSYCAVMIFK